MSADTAAPRTAGEVLARARPFLERKGIESARLETELLVSHALGMERLQLFLELGRPVSEAEIDRARALLVRRAAGEPVAYLTGEREFYQRPFAVGPGVLVPRPETELIVDRARELLADREDPRIVDLGTGSGCLAVTLALEIAGAKVAAIDVSPEALDFARRNAEALGAEVRFWQGDGFEVLKQRGVEDLDLLVSNPPYVDVAEAAELAADVREHEPALALFAPAGDPDYWVRRLLEEGLERLRPGGALLVEVGLGQAERWHERARTFGGKVAWHRDLAGIERVLEVVKD